MMDSQKTDLEKAEGRLLQQLVKKEHNGDPLTAALNECIVEDIGHMGGDIPRALAMLMTIAQSHPELPIGKAWAIVAHCYHQLEL